MAGEMQQRQTPAWLTGLLSAMLVVMCLQSAFLFKLGKRLPEERRHSERAVLPDKGAAPQAGAATQRNADPFGDWDSMFKQFDQDEWSPFEEFRHMQEEMNSLFDDSFGRFSLMPGGKQGTRAFSFSPSLDLQEKDGSYVARMDIPGADKSNLSVKIEDRVLTVSGQISEATEKTEGRQVLRKERRTGSFKRSLMLPGPVEADKLDARYENGVLTVTIPKAKEEKSSKNVQVK